MVAKWSTMEEAQREGFSLHPWRTKERLIAARTEPPPLPLGAPACLLASGKTREALDMLAQHAGAQWRHNTLFHFDMRRVDEQGRLVAAGSLPLRGRLFKVSTPDDQSAAENAAAGKINLDVAVEVESPVLRWTKGEHLDAVLTRGATIVTNTALRDLATPSLPADMISAVSVLKPGDILIVESDELDMSTARIIDAALRPVNGRALLLEGPAHRVDLDRAKEVLREQGYDVVPRIRWKDLRSWLESIGCIVQMLCDDTQVCISRGDPSTPDGWSTVCMWPCRESDLLDNLATLLNQPVREVRAAIEQHIAKRDLGSSLRKSVAPWKNVNERRDANHQGDGGDGSAVSRRRQGRHPGAGRSARSADGGHHHKRAHGRPARPVEYSGRDAVLLAALAQSLYADRRAHRGSPRPVRRMGVCRGGALRPDHGCALPRVQPAVCLS